MSNEDKSWWFLGMAAFVMVLAFITGRHDLITDALVITAISVNYGNSSKP